MSTLETSPMKQPNRTIESKSSLLMKNTSPAKSSNNVSQIYPIDSPNHPFQLNNKVIPLDAEIQYPAMIQQPEIQNLKKQKSSQSASEVLDEMQDQFQRRPKKEDGLKTMIGKGVNSLLNVPGQTLKYLMTGGANRGKEKSTSGQARMKDENFRREHCILYQLYVIWFYIQFVILPIFILFGTLLCIASLFIWNEFELGNIDSSNELALLRIDFVIACSFSIEWIISITSSHEGIIVAFFDFENLIDGLIIFQIYWRYFEMENYRFFIFFNILRSLRILKLRMLINLVTNNLKKFVLRFKEDDMQATGGTDFDEEGELNRFIMESLIKFSSGILIESTYFLAFDDYADHVGYNPYFSDPETYGKMNYLRAIYYTIVSFSTIGYGDIYPIDPLCRFSTSLVLIVNITVMSNFLGKLIEFLFQLSPYDRDYDFSDHIVIIGKVTEELLQDFLDELVENDRVQNELHFQNQFRAGIKILIVRDDEPTEALRQMSIYYTEQMGNETTFLKESIFTEEKKWLRQANLKECKILFAFSWINENGESYESDKLISLVATGVKEIFPNLRIMLVLMSKFKDQLKKDSLYEGLEVISPFQLNNYVMAASLENPGFGTVLQHLLTMKAKNISEELLNVTQHDQFMLSYIGDMQQEIYSFECPEFYVGMFFKDVAHMLYLYGLEFSQNEVLAGKFIQDHIKDDRKMTLMAVETSNKTTLEVSHFDEMKAIDENNEEEEQEDSKEGNQQIDVDKSRTPNSQDEEQNNLICSKKEPTDRVSIGSEQDTQANAFVQPIKLHREPSTQILINPQNYQIKKGDVLYVICDNNAVAMEALDINSRECSKYVQYATNSLSMSKTLEMKKDRNKIISTLFQNMEDSYRQFNQSDVDKWKRKEENQIKSQKELDLEKYEDGNADESMFSDAFDFFEMQYPGAQLSNHTVIFGRIDGFIDILTILRKYTDRPIVLYTENGIDAFKWKDIQKQYKNVFYIKGDYLNYDHLAKLELKSALQILIMADLSDSNFPDAVGICISRILLDHYDRNDFMIELRDEAKITFLNKNPKFKKIECPNFFYPAFVSGSVHFSSMTTAILARVVYSENWLRFFEDLIIPLKAKDRKTQNKTLHSLRITKEAAAIFPYFGLLQFALLDYKPSILAFAMVKHSFGSKFHESLIDMILDDDFISQLEKIFMEIDLVEQQQVDIFSPSRSKEIARQKSLQEIRNQVKGILSKILGNRFVLTNPSFYTALEENDQILILGDLLKSRTDKFRYSMAPSQPKEISSGLEFDIERILGSVSSSESNTSRMSDVNNINELRKVKLIRQAKLRLKMKESLIQEVRKRYQGQNKFLLDFSAFL